MVLQGRVFSCNPIKECVLNFSDARDKVKIILINDIISRAAIKQINCHARRAKISQLSFVPQLSVLKLELPESQSVHPYFLLDLPGRFAVWTPLPREEGFNSLGA